VRRRKTVSRLPQGPTITLGLRAGLHTARADDLPAYLVIIIVGHIVVPLALWVETNYSPPVWLQLSTYLPFTLIASLALLQPLRALWSASSGVAQCRVRRKITRRDFSGLEPFPFRLNRERGSIFCLTRFFTRPVPTSAGKRSN